MSDITLKDVYNAVNRIEDKLDKRIVDNSNRIDVVESKLDHLVGKVGIGVVVFMSVFGTLVATATALISDWVRTKWN